MSDPKQEDGASLDAQLDRCRELAERSGYEIVADEYDIHTGFDLAERPGLMRVRKLMRQRAIDVLLVHRLDRLSRNQMHQAVIMYDAECFAVLLHSVEEGPQDQTAALGKFLTSVRAFVAEQERENIRFRSEMGRRGRAEQGRPLVGCRPLYGYLWVTGADGRKLALAPDPETAWVVKRIYRDVAAGVTLARLAVALTDEGVPTPTQLLARRGKLPKGVTPAAAWSVGTLHRLLKNPAYMGMHVAFRWCQTHRYDADELIGAVRRVTHARLRAGDDSSRVALPPENCPALGRCGHLGASTAQDGKQSLQCIPQHPRA